MTLLRSSLCKSVRGTSVRRLHTSRRLCQAVETSSEKGEGTIASVFATLSGGSLEDALPSRFSDLKRKILTDDGRGDPLAIRHRLEQNWSSVLPCLNKEITDIQSRQQDVIPSIDYQDHTSLDEWTSPSTVEEIKKRGVVVIKNVIPEEQVLQWKSDIQAYALRNNARGFPESNPQVYELYWSKAQVLARSNPNLLNASQAILSLWQQSSSDLNPDSMADLSQPLTYADRLRIRQPGDAQFALGAHIDGGGVERWEDPTFLSIWDQILKGNWRDFDNWHLGSQGQRLRAKGDMYNGPGQCSVFRPLQGWLSMSNTGPNEGTLKILPNLKEVTTYNILRPFFHHVKSLQDCDYNQSHYLDMSNWTFDSSYSSKFPGCSLGHNIELSNLTHPHLQLDTSMISLSNVKPGDLVFWHCDLIHSVESIHNGSNDSSVMYIPSIPLTQNNWEYVTRQAKKFIAGTPPMDFPGGKGESEFQGRATESDIKSEQARIAMGLQQMALKGNGIDRLRKVCNLQI
ncbi:unnamed protein product [Sympodiomycopsis kandeliae]